jgi:hypothetical protein
MTRSVVTTLWAATLATALATSAFTAPVLAQESGSAQEGDLGPLRMHDARTSFTATPLSDGTVLVVGGNDGMVFHRSAEVFDPISRRFRRVGDLVAPRYGHRATALPDGRVLITGGAMEGNPGGTKSVEIYDPETETFSPFGRLRAARFAHAAALLDDGQVLISGGLRDGRSFRFRKSGEIFDPATRTSTTTDPMHTARMMHVAVPLDDGRIVMIGGFGGGGAGERALEVYAPARQRFQRRPDLVVPVDRPDAVLLDDGRVLVVSGRSVIVAPDARSSELLPDGARGGARATATLLGDGRVVVIGRDGRGPTVVDLFDPATDSFSPAEPLWSNRQEHVTVRLEDGTVMVVGGLLSGADCLQVLDTAEIWDPRTMSTVAAGEQAECEAYVAPTPAPLPPLGAETVGGRIVMAGSAFAITVPVAWTVELVEPDPDVFAATPGSVWEALRATDSQGAQACSVSVGVAEVSLRNRSGAASNDVLEPTWHPNKRGILVVPSPRVAESEREVSSMAPMTRLHHLHDGLEHDVLYVLECANVPGRRFDQIMSSVKFLPRGA